MRIVEGVEDPLPPFVRRTTPEETVRMETVAAGLFEKLAAPSEDFPKRWMYWPKPALLARIVPGGLWPPDAEDGSDYDLRLDRFFTKVAPQGAVVWIPAFENFGYFVSCYGSAFRDWIGSNLGFHNYLAFSNPRGDFIYLIERSADYSVWVPLPKPLSLWKKRSVERMSCERLRLAGSRPKALGTRAM